MNSNQLRRNAADNGTSSLTKLTKLTKSWMEAEQKKQSVVTQQYKPAAPSKTTTVSPSKIQTVDKKSRNHVPGLKA